MNNIGKKIKIKREEKKWTQEELAKRMGYKTKSTIAKIESGVNDISQKNVIKFSEVLDTSIAYLMGWEDEKEDNKKDTVYSDIGNNIKSLRESQNITLVEMSKELSIPIEDIKAYEKGLKEIPIEYLKMFAKYFNVSVDELISFEVDNNRTVFITKDEQLSRRYKKWQERIGYDITFTEEEIDEIINFALYLISKRK